MWVEFNCWPYWTVSHCYRQWCEPLLVSKWKLIAVDNNLNQTHVWSNQKQATCVFAVSPASQVEVIQSHGRAQVKPAIISEYIPKSEKSQQNPFFQTRHNFNVALIPRVFPK